MKHVLAATVFSITASVASAQMGGMKGMEMKGMDMKEMREQGAATAVHRTTGIVTMVEAAKGRVTIKHEPVPSLSWPSMTMTFSVRDKSLLEKMPKEKNIDFEFVQQGKDYVVTSVK